MKTIKINFVNFCSDYQQFYIYNYLQKKYNVIISEKPDYLFYSDHGYDHLKYTNCIKIYVTVENLVPNFNHCDYAIGMYYLTFEDRYFRCPNYLLFSQYDKVIKQAQTKHINKENFIIRDKFCNMVVSNGLNSERIKFYKLLNHYKQTDSGGKILNNVGGGIKDKLEFQKNYKFSLAFENSNGNGYSTEKIVDAFASGGIPIYWGDPLITKIFNSKAFINGNEFDNYQDLINLIKKIDHDDKLYLSYIKEPMLNNPQYFTNTLKDLEKFVNHIFDQNIKDAKRKCEENHWVQQEKKYYLLSDRIVKIIKPLLKLKSKIKNKLVQ